MSSSSDHRNGHASSSRSPLSTPPEDDGYKDDLELQRDELLAEEDPLHEDNDVNGGCAYFAQSFAISN